MSELETKKRMVCSRFEGIRWHDSRLFDLSLLREPAEKKYDLRLSLNLIVGFLEGKSQRRMRTAVFTDCRILRTELDLLGVLLCGGDIASASCYSDAVEFERGTNETGFIGLPQSHIPLEECLAFLIELINPGGQILVIARDFELELQA
ncbi:MAG TPA: hypothetical protein VGO56_19795 [Pyrinomonadaceae bacterium]|jgi:hypothetical protein|nr:hypothetical protein [Pyrinomonadaceae bacterium]